MNILKIIGHVKHAIESAVRENIHSPWRIEENINLTI